MKAKYKLLVETSDGKEFVIVIREYSACTKPARLFKEQVSYFDGSKMNVSGLGMMKVYLRELAESINAESRGKGTIHVFFHDDWCYLNGHRCIGFDVYAYDGKGGSHICSIYLIRIDASVSFYDLLAAKGGQA